MSTAFVAAVLKLQAFLLEAGFDSLAVAMMMLTVLHRDNVVMMLLREDVTILYRLHRGVIMVLVDLTVDGRRGLLVACLGDGLIDDSGGDILVHGGVMVTRIVPRGMF